MTAYTVTAYFNDTNGGSFAEGVDANSDLRLAENPRPERYPMLDGYTRGDILVAARFGSRSIDASSPITAAERMFALMNSDNRPNGKVERSLCVGDVVRVALADEEEAEWYACARVGFTRISDPNSLPRPDYDPHLDHPERRYSNGVI